MTTPDVAALDRCEYRALTRADSGRVSSHRCKRPVVTWAYKRVGELGALLCERHALERLS